MWITAHVFHKKPLRQSVTLTLVAVEDREPHQEDEHTHDREPEHKKIPNYPDDPEKPQTFDIKLNM